MTNMIICNGIMIVEEEDLSHDAFLVEHSRYGRALLIKSAIQKRKINSLILLPQSSFNYRMPTIISE